jgi:hypothetical protein
MRLLGRVAGFFLVQFTKTRKKDTKRPQNIPNGHKYNSWLLNVPDVCKICQHFPFRGPPKYTIGLQKYHLATLLLGSFFHEVKISQMKSCHHFSTRK